jgi:hypothetical protein
MTVALNNDGVIILTGQCPVEDAETLLEHLQARRDGPVDWSGCTALHTAVLQVLMAARPRLLGEVGDEFVRTWADIAPSDGVTEERKAARGQKSESERAHAAMVPSGHENLAGTRVGKLR